MRRRRRRVRARVAHRARVEAGCRLRCLHGRAYRRGCLDDWPAARAQDATLIAAHGDLFKALLTFNSYRRDHWRVRISPTTLLAVAASAFTLAVTGPGAPAVAAAGC